MEIILQQLIEKMVNALLGEGIDIEVTVKIHAAKNVGKKEEAPPS